MAAPITTLTPEAARERQRLGLEVRRATTARRKVRLHLDRAKASIWSATELTDDAFILDRLDAIERLIDRAKRSVGRLGIRS